jgi:hypothetical protein
MSPLPPIAAVMPQPRERQKRAITGNPANLFRVIRMIKRMRFSVASFDHLSGAQQDRRWRRDANRRGSLEVDHQLKFCRLLYR